MLQLISYCDIWYWLVRLLVLVFLDDEQSDGIEYLMSLMENNYLH